MSKQKFQFKRLDLFVALLMLVIVMLGNSSSRVLAAQNQALVHPDPLSVGLKSGEDKDIGIALENVEGLYGIEFQLKFDPKVVQVQDADKSQKGVQVAVSDWLQDGFVAANQVDNSKGTITFAATLLNPAPAFDGDGVAATINFHAKSDGTSPLKFSKAILATRDATEIESEVQDGAIGVSAGGQAPVVQTNSKNSNAANENNNPTSSIAPNTMTLVLLGAAGVGVLAVGIAIVAVIGIVFFKRRN